MAYLFEVSVKEIKLYPLGGISKFEMDLNIHPFKEFCILIGGPLAQQLGYLFLGCFIREKEILMLYHYGILYFNLLPIYPLDGGKLLRLLIEKTVPYRMSYYIVIYISYGIVFSFFYFQKTINLMIMILWLILLIGKEQKKINNLYNKFLLERYLKKYNFKKTRIIHHEKNFFRNYKHIIKEVNNTYLEADYLLKKYKKIEKNY